MEKPKFEFETDILTKNAIAEHLGRLFFPDGSSIRLYFGPTGLIALIYKVKDTKHIIIQEQSDNTEFAVLSTSKGQDTGERADGK